MRFLLDTHTFLWWITDDPQLSVGAREILGDPGNEILFSAAGGWELAIKAALGKLRVAEDLPGFIEEQLRENGFGVLPVQLSHALHVATLPLHHRDPFDRLLVAQSRLEKLPILTNDPHIARYGVEVRW